MRPPDGKIDQDALCEVLHEYRHCSEDEARAIVGRYLDAAERARERRYDEQLASEWDDPGFTPTCDPGGTCGACRERREAWERVHPGVYLAELRGHASGVEKQEVPDA